VADNLICEDAARVLRGQARLPTRGAAFADRGQVKIRVAIDRQGNMRWARVIKSPGYGMDEAPSKAWAGPSSSLPAPATGRLVDQIITYTYTFQLQD